MVPRPDASARLSQSAPKQGPSKILIAAIVAVVVVLVGGVAWLRTDPFTSLDATGPAGANAKGAGLVVYPGKAKAGAPTVDLYEDFQCPYCHELETANGAAMMQSAAKGDIKLVVHMMSFLDDNLDNDSSARAANAAFCAADAGRFPQYHTAVFAEQPEKEGAGYSDATLKKTATTAGITGAKLTTFNQCLDSGKYNDYVSDTQKASEKAGVNGTPAVLIGGEKISDEQMQSLISTPNAFNGVLKAVTS
ncbi:DsbA family protein [Dermacoccaceae bacterium W4C1]